MAKDIPVPDDIEGRSAEREVAAKKFGLAVVPVGQIDPTSTKGQVRILEKDRAGATVAAHQFSVRGNVQQLKGGVGRPIAPFTGSNQVAQAVYDHRDDKKPVYMSEQGIVNGAPTGDPKYYEAKWDETKKQWEPKDRTKPLDVLPAPAAGVAPTPGAVGVPAADAAALQNIHAKAGTTELTKALIIQDANTGQWKIGHNKTMAPTSMSS